MSIEHHVLGDAGRDNALLLYLHTGQAIHRLLFDCGEGCLAGLPFSEIQRIDWLFFSHLHMDHIGGFDALFRTTYNRTLRPNQVWGPPETARILHHRFQGFLWNLHAGKEAAWTVWDVGEDEMASTHFALADAFTSAVPGETLPFTGVLLDTPDFTVEAVRLEHLTPVLAFIVREKPRLNIDTTRLEELGLPPGPWIRQLKMREPEETHVEVAGARFSVEELRLALLREFPGDTIAYLTDFLLDEAAFAKLCPRLAGCRTLVCESAYRHADVELARQNYHLTAVQAAELAKEAGVERLILIHLSERYRPDDWLALLAEAQAIFPNTAFPRHWRLG